MYINSINTLLEKNVVVEIGFVILRNITILDYTLEDANSVVKYYIEEEYEAKQSNF